MSKMRMTRTTTELWTRRTSACRVKLWGGRFTKDTDGRVKAWAESITIDEHMALEDMWGSIGHVSQLTVQGILTEDVGRKVTASLLKLYRGYEKKEWRLGDDSPFKIHDDVHMQVEARVIADCGMENGGQMHTCRSRNDQVIVSTKMHLREMLILLRGNVIEAVRAFQTRAKEHVNDTMVAYTHFQHAQPVSIAFWLTHYAAVLLRDLDRLKRAFDITDQSPLGGGAISGTSFPINRNMSAALLGFQQPQLHSLDTTGNRDFFLETLSSVAIMQSTFSRLAEEFIMWSSYEFRTLTMDDGFAMGSSMMPQKKNPGTVELLRGRTGRITGLMVAGFTMIKGLPSGYSRDFHEEKEILHEQLTLAIRASEIVAPLVQSTIINKERMYELTFLNFSTATELANYLVKKHKMPFRQTHHVIGSLVGILTRDKDDFRNYARVQAHLKEHHIEATLEDLEAVLDGAQVARSYNSLGGTGPKAVAHMIETFDAELARREAELAADKKRVDDARALCLRIAETGDFSLVPRPAPYPWQ